MAVGADISTFADPILSMIGSKCWVLGERSGVLVVQQYRNERPSGGKRAAACGQACWQTKLPCNIRSKNRFYLVRCNKASCSKPSESSW